MKCRAIAAVWFSTFLEKAFVNRVKRRMRHAHGQVRPLDVGGGDVERVGLALHHLDLAADALGGGVAPLGVRAGAVDLLEDGEVDVRAEGILDGFEVGLVAVRRELHPVLSRLATSRMNSTATPVSREPTSQETASFVSASMAVQVHTSPTPNSPRLSSGTFFCFMPTKDQISSALHPLAGEADAGARPGRRCTPRQARPAAS